MKIPVFVSVGSKLSKEQEEIKKFFFEQMSDVHDLHPRNVGTTDSAMKAPLTEVVALARHCSGALILGFEEIQIVQAKKLDKSTDTWKDQQFNAYSYSTPWNQLEAGVCKALNLPLMVFSEGVNGGIFDVGASEYFIQSLPNIADFEQNKKSISSKIAQWRSQVLNHYYEGIKRHD